MSIRKWGIGVCNLKKLKNPKNQEIISIASSMYWTKNKVGCNFHSYFIIIERTLNLNYRSWYLLIFQHAYVYNIFTRVDL